MKTSHSPRLATPIRLLLMAGLTAIVLAPAAPADAAPQWRQRRWINYNGFREPIDPFIRPNVRFGEPARGLSSGRRIGLFRRGR